MSMTKVIKTRQIIENAWNVVAIELMAAAQAFDLRAPVRPSTAAQAAYDMIRKDVQNLTEDRPLHDDINRLRRVAKAGEILQEWRKLRVN